MSQASILIVEDEALIRMMLVEMVEEMGRKVVAEAGNVAEASRLAETADYDLAVLDINLQGYNVEPVAEIVIRRGLPVIFLSGYGSGGVPEGLKGVPALRKPCEAATFQRTIEAILAERAKCS
jgi:CheY-like chemotaxis protein